MNNTLPVKLERITTVAYGRRQRLTRSEKKHLRKLARQIAPVVPWVPHSCHELPDLVAEEEMLLPDDVGDTDWLAELESMSDESWDALRDALCDLGVTDADDVEHKLGARVASVLSATYPGSECERRFVNVHDQKYFSLILSEDTLEFFEPVDLVIEQPEVFVREHADEFDEVFRNQDANG